MNGIGKYTLWMRFLTHIKVGVLIWCDNASTIA